MRSRRALHTATLLENGKVLVAGGFDGSRTLQTAEIFDPVTRTWTATANSLAVARAGHAAVLLGSGKVLVCGGSTLSAVPTLSTEVEIYDPASNRWVPAAAMAMARVGHTATPLTTGANAGKVLVAGGFSADGVTPRAELYDPQADIWTILPSMAMARENHIAVQLSDGRVLVAGGSTGNGATAAAEIYDPTTQRWTLVAPLTSARENFTAVLFAGGRVFLVGGHNGRAALPSAEIYDPTSNSWTAVGELHNARERHAMVLLADGRVLVAGGHNGTTTLASAEIFDPATMSWMSAASLQAARENFTATGLGSTAVLVAGGDDGTAGSYRNSVELSSPLTRAALDTPQLPNKVVSHPLPTLSAPAAAPRQANPIMGESTATRPGQMSSPGRPQRAAEGAGPMIGLSYFGKVRDRVGRADLAPIADGQLDLIFTVRLNAGSGNRTVTRLEMINSAGDGWNTQSPDGQWTLGAAIDLDSALVNGANDSINLALTEGASFKIFAGDRGIPGNGTTFTVVASFADGSSASAAVTVNGPAQTALGFGQETVATLTPFTPMGVAFAPDGRLFIWQKHGVVRIVKNGALLTTPFLDLSSQVNNCGDRGLLGLSLDPNFAANGYIYLLYVFEPAANPNDCSAKQSWLSRVTADPANPDRMLAGSETVIIGGISVDSPSHSGGTIRFAPDGKLFFSHGDGANTTVDPLALRAQDLNTYQGKILRINPDGSAPSDNPFYDGTNSVRSRVWSLGMRNPFRFTLHPINGEPYIGEVGLQTWEEINRGRGANFGWPCYEGPAPQPLYQAAFQQCQQLAPTSVTAPLLAYSRLTGNSIIGGTFYTGSSYPAQYQGNLFVADYGARSISRLQFDANDNLVGFHEFATNLDGPVAIEMGPDGMLYYVALNSGHVMRFRYTGNQQPPIAIASATPSAGYSPLTVNFTGSNSFDPKGGPITYLWDFGDGATSTNANPQHVYSASGVVNFPARLTVTDANGQSVSANIGITVGNLPPLATIAAPADGTLVLPGQTINFQGSATDPDEGVLPPTALSWTVLLHHNEHVHPHTTANGAGGSFFVPDHGEGNFRFEVRLTATDSQGLGHTHSIFLPMPPVGVPDVVAAYSLNEGVGTTAFDTSGNGNHGALANALWSSAGHFSSALTFDGVNGFVSVPHSASLNLDNTGALEAWVKPNSINRSQVVLAKGSGNDLSLLNYALRITDNNRVRCVLGDGAASLELESASTLVAAQFRHLACVWNGTTVSLYLDGVSDASTAQTLTPLANTAPFYLAQYGNNTNRLDGAIDEVRIYNRGLSPQEIQFDMNTPIVSTGNVAPTIASVANQTTIAGLSVGPIGFEVGDLETPAGSLIVSGTSSNQTLVPSGNIVFAGSGTSRTILLTPAAGQTGSATITMTVSDGQATASSSFLVTVNPAIVISASPTNVAPGGSLTAAWSGIPAPTATDWVGLYVVGTSNGNLQDWMYVNCSRVASVPRAAGSCPFSITTAVAPGSYELRLFKNDSLTNIANSNSFAVTALLPVVTIAATDNSATEAGPTTGFFTISRTGSTTAPLTVNYSLSGTATNASDYQALTGAVTIAAGQSAATIVVTPIDDSAIEGDETLVATLSANTAYTVGLPASATVTIADNDAAAPLPVVSITATTHAAEPTSAGQFTLSRTGSTANNLTVSFAVGGSATPGSDYANLGTSIVIPSGSATAPIAVNVIDDSVFEGSETVVVTLNSNANYSVGSPNAATVTIADNETPSASPAIAANPSSVPQGSSITASWSGIANPATRDWFGLYTVSAGNSSILSWQYVGCSQLPTVARAAGSCSLTIPSNLANGSYELRLFANDSFTLLARSDPLTVGALVLPTVSIVANSHGAEPATPGLFTISRSGGTGAPLTVTFTVTGSAAASSDYTSLGTSLVIPANAASVGLPVQVLDDSLPEGNETVIVTLSASASYALGSPSSATVTITDDDTLPLPVVTIAATANGTEPSNNGQFTVARTGGTASALTVNYTVSGTATSGGDYTALSGSVVIGSGQSNAPIVVTVLDDNVFEGNETVIVTLSSNANYTVGSPAAATVTITDNETPPAGPTITAAPGVVLQGSSVTGTWSGIANPTPRDWIGLYLVAAGNSQFLAYRYVNCNTSPSTASGSGSCALPMAANLANGSYQLRLFSNDSFNVLAMSNTFTVGGVGLPVVTIVASQNGAEPSTSGLFTLSRTGDSANPLVVNYTVAGTANNGVDYETLSGTVTIPANSGTVGLPVSVTDDTVFEGTETVIVTLSSNANYSIGSPSSATVTIADNEAAPPGATISAAPAVVNRDSSVTATWSGIVNATAADWFGLYLPTGGNTQFLAWQYVNCAQSPTVARPSGSCSLTIPSNLAPGTYQLRLLGNNSFNVIATSSALTVQ